jgi:DNA repair protein RadC
MLKVMNIRDKHKDDRPREKLKLKGASALSDFELLQAIIGSGNKQTDVSQIARSILKLFKSSGHDITYQQLELVKGLGNAKIAELLAALELSKRYLTEPDQPKIQNADDIASLLSDIRNKKQEHFIAITLDGANRVIAKRTITIGTLNSSLVHPREVFADAITDRAAAVIVAHNHPSGNLEPSEADIEVTERLKQSGKLLGIKLLDHVIVTQKQSSSINSF